MLTWLIRRRIDAFERAYHYDSSYVRDILAASRGAFFAFARAYGMFKYRAGVPFAAWYAAKIATTLEEDCGPCTQLNVDMARAAGVTEPVLRAILTGDEAGMGEEAALGFAFARASLRHDLAAADELREAVRRRWGERAVISLAYAIVAGRFFPTLKYALGHGRACARVRVGEGEVTVKARELAMS